MLERVSVMSGINRDQVGEEWPLTSINCKLDIAWRGWMEMVVDSARNATSAGERPCLNGGECLVH